MPGNMAIYSKKASELPLLMIISTIIAIAFLVIYFEGGITGAGASCTDLDGDNYSLEGDICGPADCNDNDASIYPSATEIMCDNIDQDCSGSDLKGTDADSDNYYLEGSLCGPVDCDDTNLAINPGASELCDNADNNCNTQIDENLTESQNCGLGICADGSQNRICAAGNWSSWSACSTAGLVTNETCNGLDDDCDGTIDEGLASNTYYGDADNDTYGNPSNSIQACSLPSGYVSNNLDCNDASANVYPNATEICDSLDNNCNGQIDESDLDGDGIAICLDNCPSVSNSNQADTDDDSIGDSCDKLTGTEEDVDTNVNLKIYIGSETNMSKSFTGLQTVRFKTSNGKQLVQFDFNFTNSTLDLTDIKININELSGRGSLLISGLPTVNKTIWVDQISDSEKVCVKDAEVSNITSLSTNCTSSSEVKLSCPSSSGNISCEISGTRYKISGLTHTAAAELAGSQTLTTTNTTNTTVPKFTPSNGTNPTPALTPETLPGAGATVTSAPATTKKVKAQQIIALVAAIIVVMVFVGTRIPKKPKQPQQKQQYPQYKYPYYYDYNTRQWRYYYPQQQYPQYPQQPQQQNPQQYPQQPQQQLWPQQYPQQQYPQNNQQYYWPY